jgi:hypothetical protein
MLLLAVGLGATIRIHTALTDPNFDVQSARPLLRSDPALLYYITDRIVEAGGLPPEDFRADRRVEHPDGADLPAMFSVGQELLVAGLYRWLGGDAPLHVFCVWVMGIFASLAAVAVYGLTFELTRRVRWAVLAVSLYVVLEGNYRTIGFILIREDFSVPWFALHLWAAARAARVGSRRAIVAAAVTLGLAASTWHAMGFVISIEAACLFAWFLRTGRNPLAAPGALAFAGVLAAFAGAVPMLRAKLFGLSLPMQVMIALLGAAAWERLGRRPRQGTRIAGLLVLAVAFAGTSVVSGLLEGDREGYAHVFELMEAKVRHLGRLPEDPNELSFDSRLLWQGPFQTASASYYIGSLGFALPVLALALRFGVRGWRNGRGDAATMLLLAFTVTGAVTAVLVRRTIILPSLTLPVVAAVLLSRTRAGIPRTAMIAGGLAAQVVLFSVWLKDLRIPWYEPPSRNAELAHALDWIERHVPPGEPLAADFVNSTAVLAHTRHPILQQPKYETTRSRRRIEQFMTTFAHRSPEELRRWIRSQRCRYLLVDRSFWLGAGYLLGFSTKRTRGPPPGTAITALCSRDPRVLNGQAGFRLLYRSPEDLGGDSFRVFAVD